jgi:hypothetical protein
MRKLLLIFLFFTNQICLGQVDSFHNNTDTTQLSTQTQAEADEGMDVFLLVFALVIISVILGAAAIGAFAATLFLFIIITFISFGILSISVAAGLYRRSFSAGLKTFLFIVCPVMGGIIGAVALSLIIKFTSFDISYMAGILSGAVAGMLGGVLMALCIIQIIKVGRSYLAKKYHFR